MNKDVVNPLDFPAPAMCLPEIVTDYSGYSPPFDVARLVERMLRSVPPKYLIGLKEVVLTNSSGLVRKRRRSVTRARKRKVRVIETRGLYHPAWQGGRAWIEIFADNILKGWEKGWWLSIRPFRESLIADVLFHEIGHHIQATVQPEFREGEDVADGWKLRLTRRYMRFRHPWLRALLLPFQPFIDMLCRAIARYQFRKGWISRGQLDVDLKTPVSRKK